MITTEEPVVQDGINYWNQVPATYDGVLGGFGEGTTLPRIDSLGSRRFLLELFPELCTVPSALRPLNVVNNDSEGKLHRWRALDVGAGVGRVTSDVLLHFFHDVVLLEPVDNFINEAISRASSGGGGGGGGGDHPDSSDSTWPGLADSSKSVTFLQGTLQDYSPLGEANVRFKTRLGYSGGDEQPGFDVAWCQWCLGHLSDPDLAKFLVRMKQGLRDLPTSFIVVKENLCSDGMGGEPRSVFDHQDSSLTRSDAAWKALFKTTGLKLVAQKVQEGLPAGLYAVKMYALR